MRIIEKFTKATNLILKAVEEAFQFEFEEKVFNEAFLQSKNIMPQTFKK